MFSAKELPRSQLRDIAKATIYNQPTPKDTVKKLLNHILYLEQNTFTRLFMEPTLEQQQETIRQTTQESNQTNCPKQL